MFTSESNYFSAELNLVQAQFDDRLAPVQLYQALGGRWQQSGGNNNETIGL
jgi:outer membrane protein, multidrug efflux system